MRLVSLDTAVRLAVLAETVVVGWLVVIAAAALGGATWGAAGLSSLGAGLVGVDLALGELCKDMLEVCGVVVVMGDIRPVPTRWSG